MRSVENFRIASEWDVMRRAYFITTVCVILHWPMNQHAMRSSANDVNYHKGKQELGNRWVQNWNWDEGAGTGLRSQAQAMNVHWFLYRTHKWWKSWGNQREKLSEINPMIRTWSMHSWFCVTVSNINQVSKSEMKTISFPSYRRITRFSLWCSKSNAIKIYLKNKKPEKGMTAGVLPLCCQSLPEGRQQSYRSPTERGQQENGRQYR